MGLLALTVVSVLQLSVSDCLWCEQDLVPRVPDFDNYLLTEYLLWSVHVMLRVECSSRCYFDPHCHSFQVLKANSTCIGFATGFADTGHMYSPLTPAPGYQLFLLPRASHYIGSACTSDSDCHVATSVCNDGVCTCLLGYIFSPRQHACITDCSTWGNDLTRFFGYSVTGNDQDIIRDIYTEADCRVQCRNKDADANYICVSVEYSFSKESCYLAVLTFLQVPPADRVDTNDSVQYQRSCAV
ncbi:uncharacterized protein LOC124118736 isoform X1 [Haliotis rufescens]|uniref:uncharacterized protein LOC124118736 isoform X1 n=1 Tax=Haliotis rufescens TaxID=6454 RepID=UPI001EB07A4A|nr:uncharacterized protein LOC124118736 isoform X1 [Haliotis rufescens]